ncbi:MAG: hypothetical protein ABIN97_10920 [Ginsengibacter sp.]
MENSNLTSEALYILDKKKNNSIHSGQTSYRGFVSIDQEMGREIAMNFFNPSKKSVCSQKGFLFIKR